MEIQEEGKEQQKEPAIVVEDPTNTRIGRTSANSRATGGSNVSMNGILVNPNHLLRRADEKQFKIYPRFSLQSNMSAKVDRRPSDLYESLVPEQYMGTTAQFARISIQEAQKPNSTGRNTGSFGWFNVEESPIKSHLENEPKPEVPVPRNSESMFKQNSFTIEEKQKEKTTAEPELQANVTCKCLRSKCLQLYCECFSRSLMCSAECSCYQCRNNDMFRDKLDKARDTILTKDPQAFSSKLQLVGNIEVETKLVFKRGCNCKRTMCTKRYCECVLSNVKCSYLCRCENCMNDGPSGKPL